MINSIIKKLKLTCVIIILCFIYSFCLASEIKMQSPSAVAIDSLTGRILYKKNAYEIRPMASTTKIMTAIIAIENGKIKDKVVISKGASQTGGSSMEVVEGEIFSLKDMLYGLMLPSGNDASIAIAEHIAGSTERFCEMMNSKAKELGAVNTHFITPHGLDNPEHYSTAYDMAIITKYAMKYKLFNEIVATQEYTVRSNKREILLTNTNKLLYSFKGADGVKTGYTSQSEKCLVASRNKR